MSRSEEPKKLTLRTDFTDDHVSLEVQNNGCCVTSVEHLLEAAVADESRGTVVAFAISRSIIAAQGGTLEAIRREGGVTCYLASAHRKHGGLGIGLAISRSIALSHGGILVAERRHPTAVRFSLNLPV